MSYGGGCSHSSTTCGDSTTPKPAIEIYGTLERRVMLFSVAPRRCDLPMVILAESDLVALRSSRFRWLVNILGIW